METEKIPSREHNELFLRQIQACIDSVKFVQQGLSQDSDTNPSAGKLLEILAFLEAERASGAITNDRSQRAIDATVKFLDQYVWNLMGYHAESVPLFHSVYSREKGNKSVDEMQVHSPSGSDAVAFFDSNLRSKYFERLEQVLSVIDRGYRNERPRISVPVTFDTFHQVAPDPSRERIFIFRDPLSLEQLDALQTFLATNGSRLMGKSDYCVAQIDINKEVGALFAYTPKEKDYTTVRGLVLPEKGDVGESRPRNAVTIQAITRALLTSGHRFPIWDPQVEDRKSSLEGKKSRSAEIYERKTRVLTSHANADDRDSFLEKAKQKHEQHYARFFSAEGYTPPRIHLTRSGAAANDAIIAALRKQNPSWKVHVDAGWYYENMRHIQDVWPENTAPEEADALFFCTSETRGLENQETFDERRDQMVARFLERAKGSADQPFALVVDVTFDPLYVPPALPSNVTLFRTCSLTKHARGERNFFFGCIAVNGKDENITLSSEIEESGGSLTQDGIIHMPRVTRSEIERNHERIQSLQKVFTQAFEEAQADFIPSMQWRIFHNPYCLYFEPPVVKAISESQNACDEFLKQLLPIGKREPDEKVATYKLDNHSANFPVSLLHLGLKLSRAGVEGTKLTDVLPKQLLPGDSFGLNDSRITTMPSFVSAEKGSENPFEPVEIFMRFSRVSIGFDETPESITALAKEFSDFLTFSYPSRFYTNKPQINDPVAVNFNDTKNICLYSDQLTDTDILQIFNSQQLTEGQRKGIIERNIHRPWEKRVLLELWKDEAIQWNLSHIVVDNVEQLSSDDVWYFLRHSGENAYFGFIEKLLEQIPPLNFDQFLEVFSQPFATFNWHYPKLFARLDKPLNKSEFVTLAQKCIRKKENLLEAFKLTLTNTPWTEEDIRNLDLPSELLDSTKSTLDDFWLSNKTCRERMLECLAEKK